MYVHSGKLTFINEEQFKKAAQPIDLHKEKLAFVNVLQLRKAYFLIVVALPIAEIKVPSQY